MDAYAKDKNNTRYSIEMQVKTQKDLSKRARYYGSQIDMDILLTGVKYQDLPDTYVIFICDFDPFGKGLYRYTQEKICRECPNLSMEDGAHIILLSTKGTNKEAVTPELLEFLKYVDKPTDEEQEEDDEFVCELKESVKGIKVSREMGALFMTWDDMIQEERDEAAAEAVQKFLLNILKTKGEVSEKLESKIKEVSDLQVLQEWGEFVLKSETVEDFAKMI